MTHRTVAWVCEDCHPELGETGRTTASERRAVADGGRRTES